MDDEPSIRKYLQTLLEVDGFDVETVSSERKRSRKVNGGDRPDFIILDVLMPELNGIETLKELMQIDRSLNVIMLSCSNEVGTVVEAIRIGAHDYLTKPFEKTELDAAMLKSRQKKRRKTRRSAITANRFTKTYELPGSEPTTVRIRQQILQIAPVDVPVFICGESGVGTVSALVARQSLRATDTPAFGDEFHIFLSQQFAQVFGDALVTESNARLREALRAACCKIGLAPEALRYEYPTATASANSVPPSVPRLSSTRCCAVRASLPGAAPLWRRTA